jgi:hypothetical protein
LWISYPVARRDIGNLISFGGDETNNAHALY